MTTAWTREHLASGTDRPGTFTAVFDEVPRMLTDVDIWDMWPIRTPDGGVAEVCGAEVWVGLSAPARGHPGLRHDLARLRWMRRDTSGWTDLGPLFPDGASLGSREWAGSTVLDEQTGELTGYYTAAGVRGEPRPTFRQRIVAATGRLDCADGRPRVAWGEHRELVRADGERYVVVDQADGVPGFIKAFRDPFPFQQDGERFLLFTGSVAHVDSEFNGCVGIAVWRDGDWQLLDPVVTAVGVNNELERPHVVVHAGRTYLFFSTQRRTFDPSVSGPTGLYGFVSEAGVRGPYAPLNGSGIVLQNPTEEPFQAYSWLVLDDLTVSGFVDAWGLRGRHPDDLEADGAAEVRRHFGGTITPFWRLELTADGGTDVRLATPRGG